MIYLHKYVKEKQTWNTGSKLVFVFLELVSYVLTKCKIIATNFTFNVGIFTADFAVNFYWLGLVLLEI